MTDTDPVPEEVAPQYRYPLLARWFGIDVLGQQIADAFASEQIAALADLQAILDKFEDADEIVDSIEAAPEEPPVEPIP